MFRQSGIKRCDSRSVTPTLPIGLLRKTSQSCLAEVLSFNNKARRYSRSDRILREISGWPFTAETAFDEILDRRFFAEGFGTALVLSPALRSARRGRIRRGTAGCPAVPLAGASSSDYFVAGFLSIISVCLSIALDFEAVLLSALTELATIFPSFSL
jgi:hypothetical protein